MLLVKPAAVVVRRARRVATKTCDARCCDERSDRSSDERSDGRPPGAPVAAPVGGADGCSDGGTERAVVCSLPFYRSLSTRADHCRLSKCLVHEYAAQTRANRRTP